MLIPLLTMITMSLPLPDGRRGESCIDPAAPLEQLALSYPSWPQPRDDKSRKAFAAMQGFLQDGKEASYRSALRQYQMLDEDSPGNLHVQLALGVLYTAGPDLNPAGTGGYRNRWMKHSALADDRASRALGNVIDRDPSQWLAMVALTRIAVATRENGRMKQAVQVVERALERDPSNVTLQLAWSDLLIARNKGAEALAFWNSHPADCTSSKHARAEALMVAGDSAAGAKLYVEALAGASANELDRFYDDVRVLMTRDESDRYSELKPEERHDWLQLFWERSAAKSGITVESRVTQHARRVAVAQEKYRRATDRVSMLAASSTLLDLNDPNLTEEERRLAYEQDVTNRTVMMLGSPGVVPWDERGAIYVRQGEPDTLFQMAAGSGTRIPRNETWLYARSAPPWLLSFARSEGPDYFWTYSVGCGYAAPPSIAGRSTIGSAMSKGARLANQGNGALAARDFYLDLAKYDGRFEELAKYCGLSSVKPQEPARMRAALLDLRRYYRPLMDTIMHTESAPLRFRKAMRMIVAAYSFRDARGRPEVTALTWIPTPELREETPTDRLRLTYTLVDKASKPLRQDTIVAVPQTSGSGLLRGATTWHDVSMTNARLLVVATNDAEPTRGVQKTRDVSIALDPGSFSISDLVVGEPDADGLLVRGNYRISPLPAHAITSGREFRLFFELYGVTPSAELQTTIKVTRNEQKSIAEMLRLYPGRRDQRELSFASRANLDGRGIAVQDVAVGGDLFPGDYTIEVTVRGPGGEIKKKASLQVDPPKS